MKLGVNCFNDSSCISALLVRELKPKVQENKNPIQAFDMFMDERFISLPDSNPENIGDKPQLTPPLSTQSNKLNDSDLTLLMAIVAKFINDNNVNNISTNSAFNRELSQGNIQDIKRKAHEYSIQVNKAEHVHKAMGIFCKIFGWVIAAVGFIGAAFTGGASLIIATVGLALTTGNEIGKAVTGVDALGTAMKPFMDKVVEPLIKIMSKECTLLLKSCGLSEKAADIAGQILGTIVAAAIIIVGSIVVVKGGAKLVTKMFGPLVENISEKVMKSAVGTLIKKLEGGVGSWIGMDEIKAELYAYRFDMAFAVGLPLNTAAQGTGEVLTSQSMLQASKIKSKLSVNAALQDVLSELLNHSIENNKKNMHSLNIILQNLSAAAQIKMQLGQFLTKQIGHVA